MDAITSFLEMGGYARYVWPAYGLATVVLLGLAVSSLRALRGRRRELAALQESRPGRRGRVWE